MRSGQVLKVNADEFSQYRHECVHALSRSNDSCEKAFQIGSWPRYDYDLDRGTLVFSQEGTPRVIASILVAGTTSQSGGTWLWSWANSYIPEHVSEQLKKVRDFGIAEGISELTGPYAPDDEHVGWQMTAIAARIMGAKGAYRCPGSNGFMYFLFTDISFAEFAKAHTREKKIDCSTHGSGSQTFVCEHLVANPQQQWFSQEPTEANPWPDSWCTECNISFEQQGAWNEHNEKALKIKLVCHFCYQNLRSKALP